MISAAGGSPGANGIHTALGEDTGIGQQDDTVSTSAPGPLDNGTTPAEDPTPNTAPAAVKPASDTPDIWKQRLWFVRYPPPGVEKQEGFGDLEAKLESFKQQVKLLNASADVKRLERDSVQQLRKQAQGELRECREKWQAKEEDLKPLREARDAQRQSHTGLRTAGNELSVKSEAELDGRLREMHHQQQHSSLSVNEEKRLLQQIKLLEGQRGKVREYASKMQASQVAREASQQTQGDFKALEAESRALREERNMQQTIFEKYRDEQAGLDAQINSIFEERTRVKGLQDDAYGELKDARRDQKQKHGPYSANRWFSQQVRRVLRAGNLEEAREMCHQQMEENLQRLEEDGEFRGEYLAMWAESRPKPEASSTDPTSSRPRVDEKADREASKARAEQMIAQALEQAKSSLALSRSSGITEPPPGAEPADGPADGSAPAPGMPLPTRAPPPKPSQGPPRPPQAAPKAPQGLPKPAQGLPKSAPPVPTSNGALKAPSAPEEPFQVPAHLLANAEPPSEEELRAKLREHNAAAVRDAEARKERQRKQAEKKKAKTARQKAERAASKQQEQQAPKTDTEGSATADGGPSGVDGDSDTPSLGVPAVPSNEFLLSAEAEAKAVSKRRTKQPKNAFQMDPIPLRRRPARRKGLAKLYYDNQLALAVGGGVVASLAAAAVLYFGLPFTQ